MAAYLYAFERLDVWKLAKDFAVALYKITEGFPREERFGLISQMNRAAVSVASNIAEGSSRTSKKDKAHFYQIAYSSLMEVTSQLVIVKDLGYINEQVHDQIRTKIYEISNKLNALHKSQLIWRLLNWGNAERWNWRIVKLLNWGSRGCLLFYNWTAAELVKCRTKSMLILKFCTSLTFYNSTIKQLTN